MNHHAILSIVEDCCILDIKKVVVFDKRKNELNS